MRELSTTELFRLTRRELTELVREITGLLEALPEGSVDRENALVNLANIRLVLARRDFSP